MEEKKEIKIIEPTVILGLKFTEKVKDYIRLLTILIGLTSLILGIINALK